MEWYDFNTDNIFGRDHDPLCPGGCPGCRKRTEFLAETFTNRYETERQTQLYCHQRLSALKQYRIAIGYFNENDFKSAKHCFYSALLSLLKDIDRHKKARKLKIDSHRQPFFEQFYTIYENRCICQILLFCYKCNNQLNRYESCIRDLNHIISICMPLIGNKPSHNYCIPMQLEEILKKAMIRRAKLFEIMGNSAHALSDYLLLESIRCDIFAHHATDLSSRKHPDQQSMAQCNGNTQQMVKFAVNRGWNEIHPMKSSNILPTKYGHTMFEYKNKIYVFGGKNYHETKGKYSNYHFLEIQLNIDKINGYNYKFRTIPFRNEHIQRLLDMKHIKHCNEPLDFAKSLKSVKWRHFIIIIGGNNYPFRNLLRYNLKDKLWENAQFGADKVPKELFEIKEIFCHSLVVMEDKLYCFGGCPQFNRLCSFDLKFNRWSVLSANIINPRTKGFNAIPEERFDHFMFVDDNEKCIYIGFGHYHRFDATYIPTDPQRTDIWKFDIERKQWFRNEILNGNIPFPRAESGYCMNNKRNLFYLFGGYSSGILSQKACNISLYAYLGDFFEFNLKSKKWKLIQSEIYPMHRAKAGICHYKDCIVLYGGYESSQSDTSIKNDLWVINMNEMRFISSKEEMKYCQDCRKSSVQIKLWKCGGSCNNTENVARYCSLLCQKRDWKYNHRAKCCIVNVYQ